MTQQPPCDKCGEIHLTPHGKPACGAHIASGDNKGKPCRNPLGYQTDHAGAGECRKHGGLMPNNRKAAKRDLLIEEARQLALDDWDEITDPFSAMARAAGKAERLEEILLAKVEDLDTLRNSAGQYGEQIDVVFAAYERAVGRLHSIITSMSKMDLIDRIAAVQSRVDENTAATVASALSQALVPLELSADQFEDVMRRFGEVLRQQSTPQNATIALSASI